MTISSTPSEVRYATDGVTTSFPIPFVFNTTADLKVLLTDEDGNISELTTGFTATGGNGSTGTLVFANAPAANQTLTILDDPEIKQATDYVSNDAFPAESHEEALDYLTRLVKRLSQQNSRTLRTRDGDPLSGDDLILPSVQNRASRLMAFDADGKPEPVAAVDVPIEALTRSIIGQLLYPQTAAEIAAGVTPVDYGYEPGDVRRYGADPTGAANSFAAIAKAFAVQALDDSVIVEGHGVFLVDGAGQTLYVTGDCDFRNAEFLIDPSASTTVAVEVSPGNGSPPSGELRKRHIFLPRIINNQHVPGDGWTAGPPVGLRIANLYESIVHIPVVSGFERDVLVTAWGTGCVYNQFYVGALEHSKVHWHMERGDASGWVNENLIIGGRWNQGSAEPKPGTVFCQLLQIQDNNRFIGCSFEDVGNIEYYVICEGTENAWEWCRWESAAPVVLFRNVNGAASREGWHNEIRGGMSVGNIVVQESGDVRFNRVLRGRLGDEIQMQYQQKLLNTNNDPIMRMYESGVSIWGKDPSDTEYGASFGALYTGFKARLDAHPRVLVRHQLGRLYFGDGTVDPIANGNVHLAASDNNTLGCFFGSFQILGGAWNSDGHLMLGDYRLWVDSAGRLRIKNGVPSSDTDGTIVGTQS